jgi:hypothetical protein
MTTFEYDVVVTTKNVGGDESRVDQETLTLMVVEQALNFVAKLPWVLERQFLADVQRIANYLDNVAESQEQLQSIAQSLSRIADLLEAQLT